MNKDQKGFSIVELILAIIVGSGLIASLDLIINNYIHLGQRSRNLTMINSYSEGKVEALRSLGYNGLSNGTSSISSELPSQVTGTKSGSLTISEPQTGLKQIDISVTYNDNGTSRTYTYRTYIGELGVGQ
ncbi:MAG TPA: hypothetical protein VFB03_01025 [Candidatus Saccharimonadales bacterium]|nr:hypothetical protein [Candidatus Saccharimonadales bacterium]